MIAQQIRHGLPDPGALLARQLARRMPEFAEFRRGIDELAATEPGGAAILDLGDCDPLQDRARIAG